MKKNDKTKQALKPARHDSKRRPGTNREEGITGRKRRSGTPGTKGEMFPEILDNIGISYFELDLNGNFTFFNDIVCRDLGYSKEELAGMNFRVYSKLENIGYMQHIYQEIFRTGKPKTTVNFEIIRKDGSTMIIEQSMSVMRDPKGKIFGFRGVARDITDRIRAEKLLKESEEKYRTILETMEEGLYENDLKGNFTFVNDAACRQTGYPANELIGMNYRILSSHETAQRLYEVFHRIFTAGEPEFLFTYEIIRKDGSVRTQQMNASLMRNSSGNIIGFRNLARDVTELKRAEEEKIKLERQLVQAQKMESIGRLAGGVAHDFNNMLTVILGYVELIKSRLPQDNDFLRDMLEIEKAAIRSRDLTSQLLSFSRKQIIAPKHMDLNGLIAGAQKTLARLIGEDVDLRFYPGTDLWKIKFDPSQMEQILVNLAANARDAMPDGGKLTIETGNIHLNEDYCKIHIGSRPGYYVMLGISDDGSGMEKETLQHIFEPFFTTKETGQGTGLGLATVYGIVKQNDGFINPYSEPGRGTTFKIYIPRSMEEGEVLEDIQEPLPVSGTGTVLLVEDDDMVRQITTEMLEAIGYKTLAMGNPLEVLSLFEKGDVSINLVITDVMMPKMNGNELRDRIEAIRPGIKVLFMSGYTPNVIIHQGVLKEGVHFIQKPFSLSEIARKVHDALDDK